MVAREEGVTVPAASIARGGKPGLANGIGVRKDVVVRLLSGRRDACFTGAPAGRHRVAWVVQNNLIVHACEVGEGRRGGHVVDNLSTGSRAMGILNVQGDLNGVLTAEFAA